MKRKVIQIADSTQLVSLPRKWCISNGIKKGDELQLDEEGSRIVISTEKSPDHGNVDVTISDLDRDSIMFLLRALYKNGYDEIKVRFKDKTCNNIRTGKTEKVLDVVMDEVARLNGVEIFSQKEDHLVIKSISEDTIKAFDTMMRRIFLLTAEAFEDLCAGYKTGDASLAQTIQSKHDTITKFVTYSQRLLNKVGYPNFKKTDIMYHILEIIDNIVDLVKYSARDISNNKLKASSEGLAIAEAIKTSFSKYYDLYYKFSLPSVHELNKNRYAVLKDLAKAKNKIQKNEFMILNHMEQVLEHILSMTNARIALEY